MPVTFDAAGQAAGALYPNGFGLDYHSHSSGAVRRLPEEARIAPRFDAPAGSLFHANHPTAPWSLFVADGDDEVHVTTRTQASPHGAVTVTLAAGGAAASWNGSQPGMVRITGRAADLAHGAAAGGAIQVRYRIDHAAEGAVSVGMRCADPLCGTRKGALLDLTAVMRAAPGREWRTLRIPIACLAAPGADLSTVAAPFVIESSGRFALTIADVRLSSAAGRGGSGCPGAADPIR
jgi:beta-glucosidase